MKRLGEQDVPVPGVIDFDSEPVVAGRSFMLVERVAGASWRSVAGKDGHQRVAQEAVRALQRLQKADVSSVTGCFGHSPACEPYAELKRWLPLLDRARDTVRVEADDLVETLRRSVPSATRPTIVHGDFHYGNLLFGDRAVVAILDWELASIGEPLLDVASLIVASLRSRYEPEPNSAGSVQVGARAIADLYGAGDDQLQWFIAMNCLKYVAIIAYNLRLHRSGRRIDPEYERLTNTMHGLAIDGTAIAEEGLSAECLA
jgi:aminoglycoside phosphotransferase (APT) family kinase protein